MQLETSPFNRVNAEKVYTLIPESSDERDLLEKIYKEIAKCADYPGFTAVFGTSSESRTTLSFVHTPESH